MLSVLDFTVLMRFLFHAFVLHVAEVRLMWYDTVWSCIIEETGNYSDSVSTKKYFIINSDEEQREHMRLHG